MQIQTIINYVNSWPGITGKLSEIDVTNVKKSAQSSFIKSVTSKQIAAISQNSQRTDNDL